MNEIFRLMKRNRKRAARILAQRLKNRTQPPQGPKAAKELEKERLFFWILSNFESEVDVGYLVRPNIFRKIKIKGKAHTSFGGGCLYIGSSQYYSKYVEGEIFSKIVDEIVKEFNNLEGYKGINYSFEGEIEFVVIIGI